MVIPRRKCVKNGGTLLYEGRGEGGGRGQLVLRATNAFLRWRDCGVFLGLSGTAPSALPTDAVASAGKELLLKDSQEEDPVRCATGFIALP